MNPGYFPLAATALKPQQMLMFIHIFSKEFETRLHPQTSEQ